MVVQPTGTSIPLACFRIERLPTTGYAITSESGSHTDDLREQAILLLNQLDHPSSISEDDSLYWVSPRELPDWKVGLHIQVSKSGEAVFQESWFSVQRPASRLSSITIVAVVCAVLGLAAGHYWPQTSAPPKETPTSGIPVEHDELGHQLVQTQVLREKLNKYISQEGWGLEQNQTTDERDILRLAPEDADDLPEDLNNHNLTLSTHEVLDLRALLQSLSRFHELLNNKN